MTGKRIRVLVVDDSLVFREVIARGISSDPMIEVVGKAVDPYDARDKILQYQPDVMTCDVEMPKMNGIEFIRRLLPQYPLPVIVISTVSEAVFDAMNAGAVDFVTKPDVQAPRNVENFIYDLISKIKIAVNANVTQHLTTKSPNTIETDIKFNQNRVIAIGASTGGTEAIFSVLNQLPPTIPGILIVQHIPPVFSRMFAERMNNQTQLKCKEAQSGDYVEQGKVFIAPGDQHIKIRKVGEKYKVEAFYGDRVNGHCPSVDILFDSVAKEVGHNAIGIILTGMGYDGAKGLLSMRQKGAKTLGQDRQSCVVYGMPKVAYEMGAVERQVSLSNIPRELLSILK
ncbi:chemotaxis response regulator protein-glutamate methylesterase [Mobilitalea sibirica]|uniref:Protein-glutamate methylesterase/protein-glutamine glutaminase n=1 Tax=Mobilitalea sibirica TaxID=1462919 RepID=A0A8J7H7E2_9FIRM|nr:chemotaxis response regulator protein-glutamate methylesterase [Mobilitalea sibirica]MBH1941116.1 chemotaxis response regulator protein-glutamate methylesterase [Mobilitalea sibirica]